MSEQNGFNWDNSYQLKRQARYSNIEIIFQTDTRYEILWDSDSENNKKFNLFTDNHFWNKKSYIFENQWLLIVWHLQGFGITKRRHTQEFLDNIWTFTACQRWEFLTQETFLNRNCYNICLQCRVHMNSQMAGTMLK